MNKKSKNNFKPGFKALSRHFSPYKYRLLLLVFLGIISAIANGFVPFITGRFFDALIALSQGNSEGGDVPLWLFLLLIWALIQLIANNIDWVMDRIQRKINTQMHLNIQSSGFIHLLKLPMSFHKSVQIDETVEKIAKAGWRIVAILRIVVNLLPQLLSIIIGIILVASINFLLALTLILGVLSYLVFLILTIGPTAKIDDEAHSLWNRSWGDTASLVHQIETIKQASSEKYEERKIKSAFLDKTFKAWYKSEKIWSYAGYFQRVIVFATQFVVFLISVQLIKDGIITVGELVTVNGYALMFFGPFVSLGHSWQVIQNGLTVAAHVEGVYKEDQEIYEPKETRSIKNMSGLVEFKEVTFKYAPDQPDVLKNISFSVKPGEVVAFVGESGVGKSTAISLISAYFFPTKGSVSIDGIDTRELKLTELRKHIAVVPQEVALFNDTIRKNIKYGVFKISDKEIERVSKEAHADVFIKTLPKKYETLVGERGIKLSVGQKQRIAIARAILRDPKILILDEPTSALDAKNEQKIALSLEKLMKDRTTFIIAHRLSTVRKADKIIVFDKGRIVEEGKHEDLIKIKNGVYRHLYEYQIGLQ